MISKQDIDLYLSQIKTDDPSLQRIITCMGVDLKNIIDEYNKAMKIIEDTKDSNVVLERDKLKNKNWELTKDNSYLKQEISNLNEKLTTTELKLNKARQLLRDNKDFRKLERTIKRIFDLYGEGW